MSSQNPRQISGNGAWSLVTDIDIQLEQYIDGLTWLDPPATLHSFYNGFFHVSPDCQTVLRLSGAALGEQRLTRPMLAGQGEGLEGSPRGMWKFRGCSGHCVHEPILEYS